MTIQDVLRIFKKWLLLIILLPIVTTMAAGFYFYQVVDEVYTAKSEILVLQQRSDTLSSSDLSTSENIINDFCHLVTTTPVLDRVAERIGRSTALVKTCSIRVSKIEDTRIVKVTVTSADPNLAYAVCDALTGVACEYGEEYLNTNEISTVEYPQLPTSPSGPQRMRNTVLGFALGLAAAIGISLLVELLNTTIRTQEDVERVLELPVLAKIPKFDK